GELPAALTRQYFFATAQVDAFLFEYAPTLLFDTGPKLVLSWSDFLYREVYTDSALQVFVDLWTSLLSHLVVLSLLYYLWRQGVVSSTLNSRSAAGSPGRVGSILGSGTSFGTTT
ncbi:unnamed protein product, partial [Amoebophrya sp. A25]